MPTLDHYDNSMPEEEISFDVYTRRFQMSVVIKQDKRKSGILSFVQQASQAEAQTPQAPSGQTMRPTTLQGGY